MHAAKTSVFDPHEEFQSLKESPLLRHAAMSTWKQGVESSSLYQTRGIRRVPMAKSIAHFNYS
jgi:hypothetical protein